MRCEPVEGLSQLRAAVGGRESLIQPPEGTIYWRAHMLVKGSRLDWTRVSECDPLLGWAACGYMPVE